MARFTNLMTKQELADYLHISYRSLERNEKRLGLDKCRVMFNKRVVFYREDLLVSALIKIGWLVGDDVI